MKQDIQHRFNCPAIAALVAFLVLAVGIIGAVSARTGNKPIGPAQPLTGPGGLAGAHKQVVAHLYGSGPTRYWIFEPADPTPKTAPLVFFSHGWGAIGPKYYGAWIDHIVKRGNIVVYPVYQNTMLTPTSTYTVNAAAGIRAAIQKLQTESGHVRPELDKVAAVGHSMGGIITANFGAEWKQLDIPQPKALMCLEPGKTWAVSKLTSMQLADMSLIANGTLLLAVAGDRDRLVKDVDARRIFKESTSVLPKDKNLILMVSDQHGSPSLVADHLAPLAPDPRYTDPAVGGVLGRWIFRQLDKGTPMPESDTPGAAAIQARGMNALNFYGTWKLFDALVDATFFGINREYALGDTPEQRFMGKWSDGVLVKELQVTTVR